MSDPQKMVNRMNSQTPVLPKKTDTQTSLLLEMGHELRAPLHTILGYSDFVRGYIQREKFDPQEVTRCLDAIASSSNFLLTMLANILEMARLDQEQRLRIDEVSLTELVRRLEEQLIPLNGEQGNRLEWSIPEPVPRFKTDRQRLLQILINLLTNASKFTTKGYVRLSVDINKEYLHFKVEDSGIGMSPEQLTDLFKPFQQSFEPMQGGGNRTSAGLGLFISQKLARLLGGDLTVTSSPGMGSSFLLRIPYQPDTNQNPTPNRLVAAHLY